MAEIHVVWENNVEYRVGETLLHKEHPLPLPVDLLLLLDLAHIDVEQLGICMVILH